MYYLDIKGIAILEKVITGKGAMYMVQNSRYKGNDRAKVIVIGIGECGGNIVNGMADENAGHADYFIVDTDRDALSRYKAADSLLIGNDLLNGHGADGVPDKGQKAAEAGSRNISDDINGYDLAVIVCGMGGGTGTGAAPVIARMVREVGIPSVGVVARPLTFEGRVRMANAASGIQKLKEYTDTVIGFSNDAVLGLVDRQTSVAATFDKADGFIRKAILDIIDIVNMPTLNLTQVTE